MVGKVGDSQIIVNLPVINVPKCNVKITGLKHLQSPDMGESGVPPDWARVVHHGTDEQLIQQNTIPDGETTCLGEVPALAVSVMLSFSSDRYEPTS